MKKPPLCEYLAVPPRSDGKVVAYAQRVYPCAAPLPPMPAMPKSVTLAYGFRWPTNRRSISVDECEGCPLYTPRTVVRRDE